MNTVPDTEFIGTVTKFGLEANPDGSAVLVIYADGEAGTTGRAWLTFEAESVRALKSAVRTRLPEA